VGDDALANTYEQNKTPMVTGILAMLATGAYGDACEPVDVAVLSRESFAA